MDFLFVSGGNHTCNSTIHGWSFERPDGYNSSSTPHLRDTLCTDGRDWVVVFRPLGSRQHHARFLHYEVPGPTFMITYRIWKEYDMQQFQ
jgi:hypothetical protein